MLPSLTDCLGQSDLRHEKFAAYVIENRGRFLDLSPEHEFVWAFIFVCEKEEAFLGLLMRKLVLARDDISRDEQQLLLRAKKTLIKHIENPWRLCVALLIWDWLCDFSDTAAFQKALADASKSQYNATDLPILYPLAIKFKREYVGSVREAVFTSFETEEIKSLSERPTGPKRTATFFLNRVPVRSNASHISQVASYALAASTTFDHVRIVFTNERNPDCAFFNASQRGYENVAKEYLKDRIGEGSDKVEICFVSAPSEKDALIEALANETSVCFFFLGVFENLFLRSRVAQVSPVVEIQFASGNRTSPFASRVLPQGRPRAGTTDSHGRTLEFFPIPIKTLKLQAPRARDIALEGVEGEFKGRIAVTVLSNARIEEAFSTYDHAFLDRLIGTLRAHKIGWIMVGVKTPEAILNASPVVRAYYEEGGLVIRPFDDDLPALYEHCDMFLQLPGTSGGGMGTVSSITSGCIALIEVATDAANSVSPDTLYDGQEEFLSMLEDFAIYPEKAKEVQEQQIATVIRHGNEEFIGKRLFEVFEDLTQPA